MEITTEMIKELREATGVGILDCRKALTEANGDFDKAVDFLREKGVATAAKRAGRTASQGVVELYSHGEGRVGVSLSPVDGAVFISEPVPPSWREQAGKKQLYKAQPFIY